MNVNIASRLSSLRKEKDISQKEAASVLGVSQALLSHYEKGIRECGMDFIVKACRYYDVTADYMLGMSQNRHGFNDFFSQSELVTDREASVQTLYRTVLMIGNKMSEAGGSTAKRFYRALMISAYRMTLLASDAGLVDDTLFSLGRENSEILLACISDKLTRKRAECEKCENRFGTEQVYIQTVINETEKYIESTVSKGFKKQG